jgi:transcription antitermination factor NusG
MPLLPREPDMFPEDLFSLPEDAYPWVVAHVRSRQEKVLARHLAQHAVPYYLPQVETQRKRGGRNYKSYLPLFPGYVFVRAGADRRETLWRSNVIANLIEVNQGQQFAAELRQIRELQLAGASFRVEETFAAGDAVRVTGGAFAGYQGSVVRERGRVRLIVQISLIRQAVSVEFERGVLSRTR